MRIVDFDALALLAAAALGADCESVLSCWNTVLAWRAGWQRIRDGIKAEMIDRLKGII
jgi:hypothetical protein